MDGRLLSRQSTASTGSEAVLAPGCGNCMEVLHDLYQKLEPQISKSYRPNAKYVPNKDQGAKSSSMNDSVTQEKSNKQKQMKTAKIVIGAVSEMQRRRDSVAIRKKFGDLARRASAQGIDDSVIKGVSQSLPDLTETES